MVYVRSVPLLRFQIIPPIFAPFYIFIDQIPIYIVFLNSLRNQKEELL